MDKAASRIRLRLSSIHDAKINNNIESLKTQQYYLIPDLSQICRSTKQKKRHNSLCYNLLCRYELRRQEANILTYIRN